MFKIFYYLLIAFFLVSCESDSYDLVIQNGIIYDGSGSESESADIGIIGNQIVKVGKINSKNSLKIIDASGLVVSPGFIDTHAHFGPYE
jgi:N-acyl-D-aspartate/D-glutamate deacylase